MTRPRQAAAQAAPPLARVKKDLWDEAEARESQVLTQKEGAEPEEAAQKLRKQVQCQAARLSTKG